MESKYYNVLLFITYVARLTIERCSGVEPQRVNYFGEEGTAGVTFFNGSTLALVTCNILQGDGLNSVQDEQTIYSRFWAHLRKPLPDAVVFSALDS